jgi:hypothetical protein
MMAMLRMACAVVEVLTALGVSYSLGKSLLDCAREKLKVYAKAEVVRGF